MVAVAAVTVLAACRTSGKAGAAEGDGRNTATAVETAADGAKAAIPVEDKTNNTDSGMNSDGNRAAQRQESRYLTEFRLNNAQLEMVRLNNKFAFRFMKAVNARDTGGKGFVYSPMSITLLMAMVNDGATGATRREIEETLGFSGNDAQAVNEYCRMLMYGLTGVDRNVTLDMANAIFVNKEYTLKSDYAQRMDSCYNALAESLDFKSPSTLHRINGWCAEKTNGMIPSILDNVDPKMASYLLNAIYFKAEWTNKFDESYTRDEDFDSSKGKVKMPMMQRTLTTAYAETPLYQAISLPYGNRLWSLDVLLPKEGHDCAEIISSLNDNGWGGSNGPHLERYRVDLKLPRFETSSDTDESGGLIELMNELGIRLAFDEQSAQIPGICNEEPGLFIKMMKQKAKIKVNEKGSEAAAVTVAGMMRATSAGPANYPSAVFHADHPFVYLIRENTSGAVLFTGKYTGIR